MINYLKYCQIVSYSNISYRECMHCAVISMMIGFLLSYDLYDIHIITYIHYD